MFSTVFLCGAVTLLFLTAVNLAAYKFKLSSAVKSRHLSLQGFFFALSFLPMAIFTLSNLRSGNPALFDLLLFLRNPVLSFELTAGTVAEMGEISFFMDFITAILLTSVVAVAITRSSEYHQAEQRESQEARHAIGRDSSRRAESDTVAPFIRFCRILS